MHPLSMQKAGENIMRVETFDYKFKGMRKPDNFIVYHRSESKDGFVTAQGNRTIARFDSETGMGFLNFKGDNFKFFVHLSKSMGAVEVEFPQEFITKCLEYMPSSGDSLGCGGVVRIA